MAAEGQALTAGDYIVHHLTHFQTGKPKGLVDFSVLNFDSIAFSILLGVVGCWLLWRAASSATAGVPGRFQAAVEILFEMVETGISRADEGDTTRHHRYEGATICHDSKQDSARKDP